MAEDFGQVGSAFIGIEADLRQFRQQMQAAQPEFRAAGERLGAQATGGLVDQFGRPLRSQLGTEAQKAGAEIRNTLEKEIGKIDLKKVGEQLRTISGHGREIGRALTVGVTAPLVGTAAAAIKFGGDFEDAMTRSTAIMGPLTDVMRRDLTEAAKQMSREVTFSAEEGAEAFFFLASAGLDARGSIEALPVVSKFAQAGAFDLALATDLLTDAQSALGLTIRDDAVANMENMIVVSDALVKANTLSNATVQQFSESLTTRAGAALRLVNKELTEGLSVLAVWADQGTKGAEAGTRLDIVLRDLQKVGLNSRDELDRLGISVFDASGTMRSMADIVEDLERVLLPMSDEMRRSTLLTLGFQDRSVSATASLLGFSNAIRNYETQLKNAGGTTEEVARRQLESFSSQMKLVSNEVKLAGIELGNTFLPILKDSVIPVLKSGIQVLQNVAMWFGELPPGIQKTVIAAGALVAAVGPVVFVLSSLVGSLGTALLAVNALGGVAGIAGGFTAVAGVASGVLASALAALPPVLAVVGAAIAGIAVGKLIRDFTGLGEALDNWAERAGAERGAAREAGALEVATERLNKVLIENGVILDREAGESIQEWNARVVEAARNAEFYANAQDEATRAAEEQAEAERAASEAQETRTEIVAGLTEEEQKRLDAEEALRAEFERQLRPAEALNEQFDILRQHYSDDEIIAVYGDAIQKATEQQREFGNEITGTVVALEAQIEAQKEQERILNITGELIRLDNERAIAEQVQAQAEAADEFRRTMALIGMEDLEIPPPPEFTGDLPIVDADKAVRDAEKEISRLKDSVQATEERIQALRDAGHDNNRILALMGKEIKQTVSTAREFGFELGALTDEFGDQIEATERSQRAAEAWEDAWSEAAGRVSNDFANAVTDMIFEGERFSFDLKDIFKDLGKSLLKLVIQDAFGGIAQGLSGLLSGQGGFLGAIGGALGGGGGFSGLLGSIPGLGGIFGGGGGGAPLPGAAAGSAAAGGGGFLSSVGGIGGAIGLGSLAFSGFKAIAGQFGKGRKAADKFVEGVFQPTFGGEGGGLIPLLQAQFEERRAGGNLTLEEAKAFREQILALLQNFIVQSGAFAAESKDNRKVVEQGQKDLNEQFGDNFEKLLDPFNQAVNELQGTGAAVAEGGVPSGGGLTFSTGTGNASIGAAVIKFDQTVGLLEEVLASFVEGLGGEGLHALSPETMNVGTMNVENMMGGLTGGESGLPPVLIEIEVNNEFAVADGDFDPIKIRDRIIPEITKVLETGIRGTRERWVQLIADSLAGITGTTTPSEA